VAFGECEMNRHWQYLKYVLRHKWFVFVAGLKIHPPTLFQWPFWIVTLILHDWDKFMPDEWFAYRRRYFNDGDYQSQIDTALENADYQMAWHLHQKRNKHHWQWWITPKDDETFRILPMREYYIREMVADWYSMSQIKTGSMKNTPNWYDWNKGKIIVHPITRKTIERLIDYETYWDEIEAVTNNMSVKEVRRQKAESIS
jgi:hypothetical protein